MTQQLGLGRNYHFDARNLNYLIKDVVPVPPELEKRALLAIRSSSLPETTPQPGYRYFWDSAWWGNQGNTSECTAYALSHAMADGPVTHPGQSPILSPDELYARIQAKDRSEGRDYGVDGGATSLAMAKTAMDLKWIGEYRWGYTLADFIAAIAIGPVLLGINWYSGMDEPDNKVAIIRKSGWIRGGHEIECNGADFKAGMARLKQSWGRDWGRNGHAYLPFEDLEKLIAEDGDVLLFRELKTDDPRTKRNEATV